MTIALTFGAWVWNTYTNTNTNTYTKTKINTEGVTFTELLGAKDPFIPSFDSDKNDDIQILKMIFEVLGTPHELQHPCLFKLFHEYQIQHKNLKGKDGKSYFNNIITCKPLKIIYNDDDGIELLMMMIELEANDRIKTEVALKSVFFKDINM